MVEDLQGVWFAVDRLGNEIPGIVWWHFCPTCRVSSPEPHDHRAVDLEIIMAELRRVQAVVSQAPVKQTQPEPVGEHLTLKDLAHYSKWSTRWLLDRTKDPRDPLPCYGRRGKTTFKKSEFDRWIGRQRPDAVAGVVSDIVTQLRRAN